MSKKQSAKPPIIMLRKNLFLLFFCFITVQFTFSQEESFSLESPYHTVYSHLHNLQLATYHPAIAAKTFHEPDSIKARQLAIQLKQILDGKGLYVRMNLLPLQGDYIDSLTQQSSYTLFPIELPTVYLQKIDNQWFYSDETIKAIPQLHKEVYPFGSDILLNYLPKTGQNLVMGLAIWQYLGIALMLVFAFLIYALLNWLLRPIIRKMTSSKIATSLIEPKLVWSITRLISILIVVRLLLLLIPILQLPIEAINFAFLAIKIISTILLVLIFLRIIDVFMLHAGRLSKKTKSKLDEQLVPIIKRAFQAVVIIGGIIQILRLLEVNVTALIAGISIGGLALALAAQDTVKNLIGSAMIFVDQPFQIGDYISSSGFSGTVQEVGFRTTRLKTPDSSIISVPNGSIANMSVTNLGVRVYRLFTTNLGITYDTPPELIEVFLKGLRKLIEKHPDTSSNNYYVHLNSFGDSALIIFFRAYLNVPGYAEELKVREELMLGIIKLAQALEVRFAFPSNTIYIEDFPEKKPKTPDYQGKEATFEKKMKDFFLMDNG